MQTRSPTRLAVIALCSSLGVTGLVAPISAAQRDVQIVNVDFETNVIELYNFDSVDHDLSGWRFCSHDDNQNFQYSSITGLNGVAIGPDESLFIHFDNDAGEAGHINLPAGSFATPLDRGPYAIALYFTPVNFSNGNTIADHVQWSVGGVDDIKADERSDEAVAGGVWTGETDWVVTAVESPSISLLLESEGLVLHGPDDYTDVPEPSTMVLGGVAIFCLGIHSRARRSSSSSPPRRSTA